MFVVFGLFQVFVLVGKPNRRSTGAVPYCLWLSRSARRRSSQIVFRADESTYARAMGDDGAKTSDWRHRFQFSDPTGAVSSCSDDVLLCVVTHQATLTTSLAPCSRAYARPGFPGNAKLPAKMVLVPRFPDQDGFYGATVEGSVSYPVKRRRSASRLG